MADVSAADIPRGALDVTPITALLVAASVTAPAWRRALHDSAGFMSDIGAVIIFGITLLKLWQMFRDAKSPHTERAEHYAKAVHSAGKHGRAGIIIVAVMGLLAALSWIFAAKKDQAMPARLVSQTSSPAKRSAPDDSAGDDGDANAGLSGGDAPPWLILARNYIGVSERRGTRSNPDVVQMFEDAGHPEVSNAITTPWCAAYVGAMLEKTGNPSTKSLMARSYLKWGVELSEPRRGCVVVFWRGQRNDGETGHVGFYEDETATHVLVLGGNQGDAVSVAKFHKSRVLGYRWPRRATNLRTALAGGVAATGGATGMLTQASAEIDAIKEPLAAAGLSRVVIYVSVIGAVVSLIAGGYVMYRRYQDWQSRGI